MDWRWTQPQPEVHKQEGASRSREHWQAGKAGIRNIILGSTVLADLARIHQFPTWTWEGALNQPTTPPGSPVLAAAAAAAAAAFSRQRRNKWNK